MARSRFYAAFNTKTGQVLGKTAARAHLGRKFVAFLTDIVVNQPRGKEIHVSRRQPLGAQNRTGQRFPGHPPQRSICTSLPTYSSWLNQGRAVVRQDRARRHRPRRVHLSTRSEDKLMPLYPSLQQNTPDRKVEVLRSQSPYYSHISCYSPLGARPFLPEGERENSPD